LEEEMRVELSAQAAELRFLGDDFQAESANFLDAAALEFVNREI